MKYLKQLALAISFLFVTIQPAFAQTCTYMGEDIPCDQMPIWVWLMFTGLCVFGLVAFLFWIWMLIDVIKKPGDKQVMWLIVVILTGWIGALIYFFMGRENKN